MKKILIFENIMQIIITFTQLVLQRVFFVYLYRGDEIDITTKVEYVLKCVFSYFTDSILQKYI